jgi:hypothetical protein
MNENYCITKNMHAPIISICNKAPDVYSYVLEAYLFHETRRGSTPLSVKSKALAAYLNNLCLRPTSYSKLQILFRSSTEPKEEEGKVTLVT